MTVFITGVSDKTRKTERAHPEIRVRHFTLPACPECCKFCTEEVKKGCFGTTGRMSCDLQQNAYRRNLQAVRDGTIWAKLDEELDLFSGRARKAGKTLYLRVHSSGDYFSKEYLQHWLDMAGRHPDIIFYSYTKAIGWVKLAQAEGRVPDNFRFVFSIGSTQDILLDETDRVAGVFPADAEVPEGWYDGSHDDYWAAQPAGSVFLRYHGPKAKQFTAIPVWMQGVE